MKKIISMLVALVLCLSAVAFAESVPSKTTGDLVRFEVEVGDPNFVIRPVAENEEAYQQNLEICRNEIAKLTQSENVAAYFGEIKNAAGEAVDLKDLLGIETLNVYEFCPVNAMNYEESMGDVRVNMLFSTPYAKDEKVVILIGLAELNADGTQSIEWIAYEGVAVDDQGSIQVELDSAIVQAIQNGVALLAVVSK